MTDRTSVNSNIQDYISRSWPIIPLCPPDHQHVSDKHKDQCRSPGKRPLLREWQHISVPDWASINHWFKKYPTANIGLVLGSPSGIVAIDVDGDKGTELLQQMSGGDLPDTVSFSTPNGLRYLYRAPAGITLKKHKRSDPSLPHNECALMGEGNLTVLPPSIHHSGKTYEWIKHPKDVEIAEAPSWMVSLMTPSLSAAHSMQNRTSLVLPKASVDPDLLLADFAAKCSQFSADWIQQQGSGIAEDAWFDWIRTLTNAGAPDAALAFSQASPKHNQASETRIHNLVQEGSKSMTRCSTFGCSEQQISQCFHKINRDEQGRVKNSPGGLVRGLLNPTEARKPNLQTIGFYIDPKKGTPKGLNSNAFVRYVVKDRLTIKFCAPERFYSFAKGIWKYMDENELARLLREILHEFVPDFWTTRLESEYLAAIAREAPRVEKMDAERNYLNLENGMLNLSTLELEPHRPEALSTVRVPIWYDMNAECPEFLEFLSVIFDGDEELIDLVAEIFGYCLTTETRAHKAFIFYGKGSNGKSVLIEMLKCLIGKANISSLTLGELDKPFSRYGLVDKLLNVATENEVSSSALDTTYFKAIVSGEEIQVEKKHEQGFSYAPYCKLVFALNNLPYSKDKSFGFRRRLIIVPFNKTFEEGKADVFLQDKLKKELPGILNFALKGLVRLRKNRYKFSSSKAVDEALQAYTDTLNPVQRFVREKLSAADSSCRIRYNKIMSAFDDWADKNGHQNNYSQAKLSDLIKDCLKAQGITFETFKSGGLRGLQGISLVSDEQEERYGFTTKGIAYSAQERKELLDIDEMD
ncbi:phage/plasmid primase, P4 family [Paenibacillus curdlanolyticus YK9]|uniref:Phage/plasmid primase, P4 family n=1 Tax=Paenibacillus curdlanolyticus YK9 TaxID=717606 RepID=E0ID83_9BACL|nr:phage/plasmid primase, P4 family [Paenibacillus curdlanolyticus]EFM09538.1 phage/plasmid primase, P4 family [Paenibacillus curdlanolyticus YK9]